jgi:DNA-binding NarL/FixJ family response regulator
VAATIIICLFSAHRLWLQAFSKVLSEFQFSAQIKIVAVEADSSLASKIQMAFAVGLAPDLALVAADNLAGDLATVRTLRSEGYRGPVLVIFSRSALPDFEELVELNVQSIVSSSLGLEELQLAISELCKGGSEPIEEQYLKAQKALSARSSVSKLNKREKEIVQLLAHDLTDQQIADKLDLSVRTVSNHLRQIYVKLGVKSRLGAVVTAITEGLIRSHTTASDI